MAHYTLSDPTLLIFNLNKLDARYVNSFGDNEIIGQLLIDLSSDTEGIIIQADAAQTANLQEWQDSAGNNLAYIGPTGDLYGVDLILSGGDIYPTANSATAIQINQSDGTTPVLNIDTSNIRVGIGTNAPSTALHVVDDNATSVLRLDRNQAAVGTDDIVGRMEIYTRDTTDPGVCAKLEAVSYGTSCQTGWRFCGGTPSALTEFIRIDNNGFVGIGGANPTIQPDQLFHLEYVTGAIQRFTRQDTTVSDDDIIGRIEFETQDTDSAGIAAIIQAEAEGSSGEVGISIHTGTGGSSTERMRIDNTGEITLLGNTRVYKNEWIPATAFHIPAGSPATQVEWGISSAWQFDDSDEDIVFASIRLPQDMDRTDPPQFKIGCACATAGDGAKFARWQLEYLYCSQNDDTHSAAEETLTGDAVISTTQYGLSIATVTGIDLPSATDQLLLLRITRLGNNDDIGANVVMLGCGLRYTSDKFGVSL